MSYFWYYFDVWGQKGGLNMNKLDLLKLKKSLLTSLLIATTALETFTFSSKKVKASEVDDVVEIDVSALDIAPVDSVDSDNFIDISNEEINDFEIIDCAVQEVTIDKETQNVLEMIDYYSMVYDLDSNKVLEKLIELTNEFKDSGWKFTNTINGIDYDSKEEAIILTIRDISLSPQSYGFESKNEIASETKYVSEMSPEEINAKYADIFGVNKEISMSISYAECGPQMNSHKFRTANNPAGLGDMRFSNVETAYIYYINLLKTSYGLTKDSDVSFFSRVASKYCELPEHWISLTTPHYYNLVNDYYHYNKDAEPKTLSLTKK